MDALHPNLNEFGECLHFRQVKAPRRGRAVRATQIKGTRMMWMDSHFGTVPHPWVYPSCIGLGGLWFLHLLFKRGKDLSCTHVSGYKFPHTLKEQEKIPPFFQEEYTWIYSPLQIHQEISPSGKVSWNLDAFDFQSARSEKEIPLCYIMFFNGKLCTFFT